MAEHDDNGLPPNARSNTRFGMNAREFAEFTERQHAMSNRVHDQAAAIAVLRQRADDQWARIEKSETSVADLREHCDEAAKDARRYASKLVSDAKAEATAMVDKLSAEMLRIRTEEKTERREETNRTLVKVGLLVTVLSLLLQGVAMAIK